MYNNFINTIKLTRNSFSAHRAGSKRGAAFTLIETLVAISLLTIAVVAPMSLTTQSLGAAYYARDQVTAYFLAQEAIEGIRAVRDGNILITALGTPTDLLTGIPNFTGVPFTLDVRPSPPTMTLCPGGTEAGCPVLKSDGTLYGYESGWSDTTFTRYVTATYEPSSGNNEVIIEVNVKWRTGSFQERRIRIKDNLYRWVNDN